MVFSRLALIVQPTRVGPGKLANLIDSGLVPGLSWRSFLKRQLGSGTPGLGSMSQTSSAAVSGDDPASFGCYPAIVSVEVGVVTRLHIRLMKLVCQLHQLLFQEPLSAVC